VAKTGEIRTRFDKLAPFLDERMRRLVAASESLTIGFGGTSEVSRQTGVSRRAIIEGIKELGEVPSKPTRRVRRSGGGRKKTVDKDASLKTDLERLVEPVTRGDPESPLRWTCKSVRKLADELKRLGHLSGVNYFSLSTTIILPYQRQLPACPTGPELLHCC